MEKISETEIRMSYEEIMDLYVLLSKVSGAKKDKLSLCMGLLAMEFDAKMKQYNRSIDDIDMELASVDSSGDVKVNNRSFCFTKENTKKRRFKMN